MRKNLEMLDKIYNLRYKSGKVHLFYSINKLVGRFGNVISLDKIYVSKEYLSYLSEKLFQDKNRLISFFGGNNKFVRLSLVHEFMQDFGRDIAQDIKDDFMEIKIGFEICGEELFILNGELVGQFTVTEKQDISLNQLKTNAIAIMFPFLRSQITLLTSQPSLVPIVLPPININKVLESQMR